MSAFTEYNSSHGNQYGFFAHVVTNELYPKVTRIYAACSYVFPDLLNCFQKDRQHMPQSNICISSLASSSSF